MKRKRILFTMMAMLLTLSFMPSTIHAQETATQNIADRNLEEPPIWGKEKLSECTIYSCRIYTYPVAVNTSAETQIGFIEMGNGFNNMEASHANGLIPLTGDMIEGFDSSTIGKKTFYLNTGNEKFSVDIEVVAQSDMSHVGKPVSIRAALYGQGKNILSINSEFGYPGTIEVLDDLGQRIYAVYLFTQDIPNFDNTQIGKKSYPISYLGMTTTLEVEFHKYDKIYILSPDFTNSKVMPSPITVPINADLNNVSVFYNPYTIDESGNIWDMYQNEIGRGAAAPSEYKSLPQELIKKIDTSKAGVYDIDETLSDGRRVMSKVIVGTAAQSTIEKLLSQEAQATMPAAKKDVLSVWDVPSGEAGAGTWVFSTGMNKGNTVVVWSYHNQKWLKIGTYAVDQDGNITVTFTADQLSPVILVKGDTTVNDQNSPVENNKPNENKPNENNKSNVKTDIIKDTSKTKQTANALPVIAIFIFLGFAIFSSSKDRQKQNN